MNAANLVRDYLPLPPTPTRRAFPNGYFIMRPIMSKCSTAKLNNTKSIGLSLIMLWFSRDVSTANCILA
jgi:hypothetical protein